MIFTLARFYHQQQAQQKPPLAINQQEDQASIDQLGVDVPESCGSSCRQLWCTAAGASRGGAEVTLMPRLKDDDDDNENDDNDDDEDAP